MAASFQQYMGNKGAFHPQGEKAKYSSDQANLNRQHIGDQNRLPVPITTLHHGQTRVSRQKKSPGRKISPQTRNRNNNLQTNNGITHHQGLFDTDAEDGDRTTTLSEISKEDLRYQNVDFANTKPRYQPEYSPASSIHAYEDLGPAQSTIEYESEAEEEDMAEDEASQESGSGDEQPGEIDTREILGPQIFEELNRPGYAHSERHKRRAQDPSHFVGHAVTTLPTTNNKAALGYHVDDQHLLERRSSSVAQELRPRLEGGQTAASRKKHSVHIDHLPHRGASIDRHHYDSETGQRQKTNGSIPDVRAAQEPAPQTNTAIELNPLPQPPNPLEHVEPDTQGSPGVFDPSSLDDDIIASDMANIGIRKDSNVANGTSKPSTNKRMLELDYTPNKLATMTFDELFSESFDHDPKAPSPSLPPDANRATLAEKLAGFQRSKADEDHNQQLKSFFFSLTINQYDECGEIIIDRISTIMDKYRKARQCKRQAAQQFEKEVTNREQSVSQGTEAVEQGLKRLKKAGEDVVRGKASS